ncbi:hypothetical protein CEUSTIGMA_g11893.t1 [Chlamydomonas eustigma]|uniref:protein-serine/threonine phosphatase n=1 Tax=Chlamydomonas eustigma TaxID=1157962 RepID=A0A250XN98_9CHLO|nr:hypothetical protein CEUSTIGMA_g11893.t1 [Chlamydomonas eustigma]|eukprot:GAX84473.1 hypothetical protein CEUSTIGMA_g11893.t1 [Chlamydomonas eustigma]
MAVTDESKSALNTALYDLKDEFGFSSILSESSFTQDLKNIKSPFSGYGVKTTKGLSKHMEDSYSVQETLSSPPVDRQQSLKLNDLTLDDPSFHIPGFSEDLAFFSVFDGHGGDEVAQHCSDRLHKHFSEHIINGLCEHHQCSDSAVPVSPSKPSEDCKITGSVHQNQKTTSHSTLVSEALRSSFRLTDQELAGTDEGEYVGATAVVAVIGKSHIWVAHCGDSRAVIQRSGDAVPLTQDHKPDREDEAARISAAGGRVVSVNGSKRVMGFLAMSRSIGDHHLRPYVIAEPEVSCMTRSVEDEVLIIATDGLWDVFSCEEATNLASRCVNRSKERGMTLHGACRVAASVLTKTAMERGSRDNITVIVVDISLPNAAPSESEGPVKDDIPRSRQSVGGVGDQEIEEGGGVPSSHLHGHRELHKSSSVGTYVLLKSQRKKTLSRLSPEGYNQSVGGASSTSWGSPNLGRSSGNLQQELLETPFSKVPINAETGLKIRSLRSSEIQESHEVLPDGGGLTSSCRPLLSGGGEGDDVGGKLDGEEEHESYLESSCSSSSLEEVKKQEKVEDAACSGPGIGCDIKDSRDGRDSSCGGGNLNVSNPDTWGAEGPVSELGRASQEG